MRTKKEIVVIQKIKFKQPKRGVIFATVKTNDFDTKWMKRPKMWLCIVGREKIVHSPSLIAQFTTALDEAYEAWELKKAK